jgi:AcrR family transcriptional regulator
MARRRAPLSRDRVLEAAVAMADEHGIEAVTMRRLAKALGVEAMSLYNHIAGKDELLDAMADLVMAEFELTSTGDWEADLRALAASAHDALLRHPWAPSLIMSPPRVLDARMTYMEFLLGTLRDAGFSAELTYRGYHAVDSHILGFTMWQLGHRMPAGPIPEHMSSFLENFPYDTFPHVGEHIRQHLADESPDATVSEFDFGLELILEGLKQMRGSARRRG